MPDAPAATRPLRYGEALPFRTAVANRNPKFALNSLGGYFILLCVVADVSHADAKAALALALDAPADGNGRACAIFCADPNGAAAIAALPQSQLIFNDPAEARACGLIDPAHPAGQWVLLDPSVRTLGFWPVAEGAAALAALAAAPDPGLHAGTVLHAPVLIAPRIFEPAFCRSLIEYYEDRGGKVSGVMREEAGKTVLRTDDGFKRRSDCLIEDEKIRAAIMQRMYWRLTPEIEKAFAWRPTRVERYIVARYDGESGGFFRPHRDNNTAGTAHRRFAVTINLNAEEYEGGDLRFPEFGGRTYRAPTGGAVVFSCSLLHEATPVTRGKRYAFLPFLYDEAAAKVREANNEHLDEGVAPYKVS